MKSVCFFAVMLAFVTPATMLSQLQRDLKHPGLYYVDLWKEAKSSDYVFMPNPPCGDFRDSTLAQIAQRFAEVALASEDLDFAGPLINSAISAVDKISKKTGGDVAKFLDRSTLQTRHPTCVNYAIEVPKGSEIVSIEAFAREWSVENLPPCIPDATHVWNCQIWWSSWTIEAKGPVVFAVFKNWSQDRDRKALLRVYFKPPAAWAKQHPL